MWKMLLNFIPGVGPFLSTLGTFIVDHWKFFAIATMIGMLGYQNFSSTRFLFGIPTIPHLKQQVNSDQVEIKQLQANLKTASDANAKLTASIQAQDLAIAQWANVSEDLKQDNAKLQATLDDMYKTNNNKVDNILKTKPPATCEASIQYLRDSKQKLGWQ